MTQASRSPSAGPLPRSLDPLPGESLAGYVLRLAHRLEISPDLVLRRNGLADFQDNTQAMAKSALSIVLPPSQAAALQTATRLSPAEATALTLAPWATRYPPIARSINDLQHGRTAPHLDWLFATTARYCPACLASDGSPIQDLHGGPWQSLWRLPVVFACPQHQLFLEHLCPTCHQPVGTRNYGHLIARPTISGLHPAQCRAPHRQAERPSRNRDSLCQGPFDQPELHAMDRPDLELLTLQDKIINMLRPDQPAEPATRYFTELQLVTALVIITWPRTRPTLSSTTLEAAEQDATARDRPTRKQHSTAPPADARACAVFLHAADTVLTSSDLRSSLMDLAPRENRTRTGVIPHRHYNWDRMFQLHRDACSKQFQQIAENLVPTFRRGKGNHRIPASRPGYAPEHVPAFLLQEWADQHLSGFTGISMKLLRRTTAAYLVRRGRGGSLNEAAQFLGISTSDKRIGFGSVLGNWVRAQDNLHIFEMAVDAIAAEIQSAPRIDYQRRRQALADWTLPPDAWQRMVDKLETWPGNRAITDDRKRLAVSAYIWARVTQGEYYLSPCPAHIAGDPAARHTWMRQRTFIGNWLKRADDHPYYRQLKPLLDDHADRLAEAIDNS